MQNYPILVKLKKLSPEARKAYIKKYFKHLKNSIEHCGDNEKKIQELIGGIVKQGRDEEVYVLLLLSMLPEEIQDELIDVFPIVEAILLNVMAKRAYGFARAYGIDEKKLQKIRALLQKLDSLPFF